MEQKLLPADPTAVIHSSQKVSCCCEFSILCRVILDPHLVCPLHMTVHAGYLLYVATNLAFNLARILSVVAEHTRCLGNWWKLTGTIDNINILINRINPRLYFCSGFLTTLERLERFGTPYFFTLASTAPERVRVKLHRICVARTKQVLISLLDIQHEVNFKLQESVEFFG